MIHRIKAAAFSVAGCLLARASAWAGLILIGCLIGCSQVSPPDAALMAQHCDEIAQATVIWVSEDLPDAKAGITAVDAEIRKLALDGKKARVDIDCSVRYSGPSIPCKSYSSAGLSKGLPPTACEPDLVSRVALTLNEHHDGKRWVLDSFQAKPLPK